MLFQARCKIPAENGPGKKEGREEGRVEGRVEVRGLEVGDGKGNGCFSLLRGKMIKKTG